jgi:hypothetical protein
MSQPQSDRSQENIHAATDPQQCREMGRRNGWELKHVRRNKDPILKVDCVF